MEELTTYKVTFIEGKNEWIFQYRKTDGVIYQFINLKGNRILQLLNNAQFPQSIEMIEQWTKHKKILTIELVLDNYDFQAFWEKYDLKVKKDLAEKVFNKLTLVDKIKCFNILPKYDSSLAKTGQSKAHLSSWLNAKRYNDEYK